MKEKYRVLELKLSLGVFGVLAVLQKAMCSET